MLSCPTCGPAALLGSETLETSGLQAERCRRCEGLWIRRRAYLDWLGTNPPTGEGRGAEDPVDLTEDGRFLRRCPECSWILGRYRVGHDVHFTVDRCHNCGGVWLDRHEWTALKAQGLHGRLHLVFTPEWQQEVRQREAKEREETLHRRILGEEDYERIQGLRDWIREHPKRPLLIELLLEVERPAKPASLDVWRPES